MATPFGPQLIGETEKTLNAVLRRCLAGTGLTEPQWVTLRIAGSLEAAPGNDGLVQAVATRAHFDDAADLVATLADRGLVSDGLLSQEGRTLVETVQGRIAAEAGPIWRDLPDEDVAAATRVLNRVLERARSVAAPS